MSQVFVNSLHPGARGRQRAEVLGGIVGFHGGPERYCALDDFSVRPNSPAEFRLASLAIVCRKRFEQLMIG